MKKKIIAIALAVVFVVSLSLTVMAAGNGRGAGMGRGANPENPGLGICGGGYAFMWDENGNFLDKEAFEERIDKAISDGLIAEENKVAILEMYDYCATYGGGATDVRGGGCGRGRGSCGMGFYSNTP